MATMIRLFHIIALLLLIGTGCAPILIEPEAPAWSITPASGPSVELHWPVDGRPPAERGQGGHYVSNLPNPQCVYDDTNLRPGAMASVDRATRSALAWRGVPIIEHGGDPDFHVYLYVLHHAGWQDISDAQWISTLTGGTAATIPKFAYPMYAAVVARVRIEVRNKYGDVVAIRDADSIQVRKKPIALTWGFWYLFKKNPIVEMFKDAFLETHRELGEEISLVVEQARQGQPVDGGNPAITSAQHSLTNRWRRGPRAMTYEPPRRAETLREGIRGALEFTDPVSEAVYGEPHFSVVTGHDLKKGGVVGRMSYPLDNFAYDIGLSDRVHGLMSISGFLVQIPNFGFYNNAKLGLRYKIVNQGSIHFSLAANVEADIPVQIKAVETAVPLAPTEQSLHPYLVAVRLDGLALVSWRVKALTFYWGAGASSGTVLKEFPEVTQFENLQKGSIYSARGLTGLEVQLGPSIALGFQLNFNALFQNGDLLDLGTLGGVQYVPQISIGLR